MRDGTGYDRTAGQAQQSRMWVDRYALSRAGRPALARARSGQFPFQENKNGEAVASRGGVAAGERHSGFTPQRRQGGAEDRY